MLEKVKRRATKLPRELRNLSYEQGLQTWDSAPSKVGEKEAISLKLIKCVEKNIVRKTACLRVLCDVLKGVWSPPIRIGLARWSTFTLELGFHIKDRKIILEFSHE
ncbi:jg13923 [Pararge aegeria aegeria]|uniref:Jg13923 protein n=1 Tax=Pararge aegeria aegeria TaxID=348720 RepID=A0A8S4SKU2_9NEOP|nr:jg13923 [Pararge aegeria aegeria]